MPEGTATATWTLEVVRGRDVGRRFPLTPGETVAGNALNGLPGLDLAPQEGTSPRRMAPRQARFQCIADALLISDLGSPGGTFVNRERLAPFQPRSLSPGDVIQLASVQLRVERPAANGPAPTAAPPPPPSRSAPPAAFLFKLASGPVCRTWDDFLTVSAQDWTGLRDELTSGRLAAFLASTGRAALAPDPNAPGTPDERLDAWLRTLPTSRPAAPELDAHPARLTIAAGPAGGTTRRTLTITNAGYGLLRTTAKLEPPDTPWLRLADGFENRPFTTLDRTTLPIDLTIPESLPAPLSATLVLESDGGTRRIPVTLEPRTAAAAIPGGPAEPAAPPALTVWADTLRPIPARTRLLAAAVAFPLVRLLLAIVAAPWARPDAPVPALPGPALLGAVLGALAGFALLARRGGWRDRTAGLASGAVAGVLTSAALIAALRSIESLLGPAPPLWQTLPLWALIGLALGGLSLFWQPDRSAAKEAP